jgi:hypothetical protein
MALNNTLMKSIDSIINEYISRISTKYTLDKDSLRNIWDGKEQTQETKNTDSVTHVTNTLTKEPIQNTALPDSDTLMKCNKNELMALCKTNGHKWTGTKILLLSRLLGKDNLPDETQKTKTTTKTKDEKSNLPVIKKIIAKMPTVSISRNQFDNYEHPESHLLFNQSTQLVIGKQNDNGNIDTLTDEDINTCKKYKFKYVTPENLDSKCNLEDVTVEELDVEDDIPEDEEELLDTLVDEGDDEEYEEEEEEYYEEEN